MIRGRAKAIGVVLGVILSLVLVLLSLPAVSIIATSNNSKESLTLVGYEYNRDLVQLSLTLWNKGTRTITIKEVHYDGARLQQGLGGQPATYNVESHTSVKDGIVRKFETNELIFAQNGRWNFAGEWQGTPAIQQGGIASMYVGVTAKEGSKHRLKIIAEEAEFTFELIRGGPYD